MGYLSNWQKIARMTLVVGLLAAGTWGCGGDDDDDDEPIAGTSGGGGTRPAGMGGGGSGGGMSGMGGMAGTRPGGMGGMGGMIAPVTCMPGGMATMCPPVMTAAGTTLPPCCDAMEGMACGARTNMMDMNECIATKQAGVADMSCPTAQSVLGMMVPGCCKPNGKCGLMSGTLMGCVENSRYPMAFLMAMSPRPAATNCGGQDAGL